LGATRGTLAEAQIAREGSFSAFRAARTTIAGSRAVSEVMTVQAPAQLTYRELDSLLAPFQPYH
jgi:hypothetical protein